MDTGQIFLIAGVILILFFLVRRSIQRRAITQLNPKDLAGKVGKDASVVLLDVRSQAERNHQFIKGSVHIPLHELHKRVGELERYRSKQIVCYCQSGSRSTSAALLLKKSGFTVANMSGGIAAWNFSQLR